MASASITSLLTMRIVTRIDASHPLQLSGDFLTFAVVFFLLAILAAAVGARGIAGITMAVAKWFVIIFIVLALITLLL